MTFTFTSSGAIIRKAGLNANSTVVASAAALLNWATQAEGFIEAETRRDWTANYAGLPNAIKNMLNDAASSLAAIQVISYDMSGYTSRLEATTMLDVLRDNAIRALNVLKDFKSNIIQTP